MTAEEIIKLASLLLGSTFLATLATLWFNRRITNANADKTQAEAKVIKAKSEADFTSTLLDSSEKLDKRRDDYISDIRDELQRERGKSTELEKRIAEMEKAVGELRRIIAEDYRYRIFFNLMEHPAMFVDVETGKILDVNARAVDAYRYTREEMLGMNILSLCSDGTKAIRDLRDGVIHMANRFHRTRDNTLFPVDERVSYFMDGEKRLCMIVILPKKPISVGDRAVDLMEQILSEFSSSYVSVWSFHNGEYGKDGSPIFKLSAIRQVSQPGLRYLADMFQNMPASMFGESLRILVDEGKLTVSADDTGHEAVIGAMKHVNICTMAFAAIYKKDTDQMIGILSISYNQKTRIEPENMVRLQELSRSDVFRSLLEIK